MPKRRKGELHKMRMRDTGTDILAVLEMYLNGATVTEIARHFNIAVPNARAKVVRLKVAWHVDTMLGVNVAPDSVAGRMVYDWYI